MNTLQQLVQANLEISSPQDMYLRLDGQAWAELARPRVHFGAGAQAWSDTFYNGLTVGTWKSLCAVRELVLMLRGSGDFVLTFGLHRRERDSVWLSEHGISLAPGGTLLPVPAWAQLSDGMLFFRLRALGQGVLEDGAYLTPDAPLNPVRLGLVITHFNRQAQVLPAIGRIRSRLLERPEFSGRLTLTVVDNSSNLALEPAPGIEVIPNRNLGGTGGFVRGLLALRDGGRHTHALFMDDDASCETEAIARSLAVLQYTHDPQLAVAGALLRELAPWQLFEKGARFDGKVEPLCSGLDMRRVEDLLQAERREARPDYGAWWFFAFPIDAVRQYPFPFFVRGDDVLFGLGNAFHITTLNGVACYGEDFGVKHSPLSAYLDARYHLVHALLADRRRVARIFMSAGRLFLKSVTSYHYTGARAVTLALRHVLEGPEFFRRHVDLQSVRREIGGWTPAEKLEPIDCAGMRLRGARTGRESVLRRLARLLSLQGFLLPGFLLLNRTTVQDKAFHGSARAIFRYRRVLYRHAATNTGYLVEYDRARFFAELGAFIPAMARLLLRMGPLRRAYALGVEDMTSLRYWRSVYPPGHEAERGGAGLGATVGEVEHIAG